MKFSHCIGNDIRHHLWLGFLPFCAVSDDDSDVFEFCKLHEKYLENIWERNRVFSFVYGNEATVWWCELCVCVCVLDTRDSYLHHIYYKFTKLFRAIATMVETRDSSVFHFEKKRVFFLVRLEINRRNQSNTRCRGATTCKYRTVSLASYTSFFFSSVSIAAATAVAAAATVCLVEEESLSSVCGARTANNVLYVFVHMLVARVSHRT